MNVQIIFKKQNVRSCTVMTLETHLNHSCQIKCPSCEHKYLYNFKIQDIEKIDSKEKEEGNEIKYKFTTYLICKNPLCNYDIEVI